MKLPIWLFWWEWVKKIFWDPFYWVILFLIILWVPFLRVWWWFFLPLMLVGQLKTLYLWWLNWDFNYAKSKWVFLEIIPPKEVLAPFKAMEDVFSTIWTLSDQAAFEELWCEGALKYIPYWFSFEIVSIEGRVHFYLRCLQAHRLSIETALYAHYPDIEVNEVEDYTKLVPLTLPNEEWDMYGEDYVAKKNNVLPIKTYDKFFEPQGERISAEEKRIDPIISLLEGLSKLGPGEHYWVQFILLPALENDEPDFKKEAEKLVNKLSKRPEKKEMTLLEDLGYIASQVILGPEKEGSGDKATYKWQDIAQSETGEREMVLTPGEREIISEIENKAKKAIYRTVLRGIYVAKRENWKRFHRTLARSYFSHFGTQNMNFIMFDNATRTRIHYFMRKRRIFLRARKMFRNAILRFTPLFPDRSSVTSIFSPEELATIFHFPLRTTGMVSPTLEKVESKKAGPPPNLPVE
jgi:hypothetical protein